MLWFMMTKSQQPSEFNKRVGENLARLRKGSGLSQTGLAQLLSGLGFPFQQPTVLKVEKGSRPLKLEEAAAIADLLRIPVGLLQEASWGQEWAEAVRLRQEAFAAIQRDRHAIEQLEKAIQRAEEIIHSAESRIRSGGADLRSFEARAGIPLSEMRLVDKAEAAAENFSGEQSEYELPAQGEEGTPDP